MYTHTHTHTHICMYVYIYTFIYIYIHKHTSIFIYIFTYIRIAAAVFGTMGAPHEFHQFWQEGRVCLGWITAYFRGKCLRERSAQDMNSVRFRPFPHRRREDASCFQGLSTVLPCLSTLLPLRTSLSYRPPINFTTSTLLLCLLASYQLGQEGRVCLERATRPPSCIDLPAKTTSDGWGGGEAGSALWISNIVCWCVSTRARARFSGFRAIWGICPTVGFGAKTGPDQ